MNLKNPFQSYVAVDELPRTGDARKFVITLPFQIEGAKRVEELRWEFKYTGTQEAIDANNKVDGLAALRDDQLRAFERHVERDLKKEGHHLYEVEGQRMLVRGPVRKA